MFDSPMYNRPENLWKDFSVERKKETVTKRGRAIDSYYEAEPVFIHAVLTGASYKQIIEFEQAGHPISHIIAHKGGPVAKEGDRLIFGKRIFYIQGVENPGDLSLWTVYYAEERGGTNDGNQLGRRQLGDTSEG